MRNRLRPPTEFKDGLAAPALPWLLEPPSGFAFSRPSTDGSQDDGDLGESVSSTGERNFGKGRRPQQCHVHSHKKQAGQFEGDH